MVTKFQIFEIAVLCALNGFGWPALAGRAKKYAITTCEEFEKGAEIDPTDIVKSMWKIIYYWSDYTERDPITFSLLDSKKLKKIKSDLEDVVPEFVFESHKEIFMMEPRAGVQVVFIYAGTPGAFRAIVKLEQRGRDRPFKKPFIKLTDIRMKQKGEYLGMVSCEELTSFVLARLSNIPATEEECEAAAASLGLKGPHGRSYYYLQNMTRNEL